MRLESVFDYVTAAHQSFMVESPFKQRGGIMLIAGPENLKTAIVRASLTNMPKALCFSDLTLKQLIVLRDNIADEKYVTLGFTELEKLYERQASVADNVEGVLKAMAEEGFSHAAFEDRRIWVPTARCLIVAAVLRSLYQVRYPRWELNGFSRRFVQFKYRIRDREKILQAIRLNKVIQFPALQSLMPSNPLAMNVKNEENRFIEGLAAQFSSSTRFLLTKKVLTVLKWRYSHLRNGKARKKPLAILDDLRDGFQDDGGVLDL